VIHTTIFFLFISRSTFRVRSKPRCNTEAISTRVASDFAHSRRSARISSMLDREEDLRRRNSPNSSLWDNEMRAVKRPSPLSKTGKSKPPDSTDSKTMPIPLPTLSQRPANRDPSARSKLRYAGTQWRRLDTCKPGNKSPGFWNSACDGSRFMITGAAVLQHRCMYAFIRSSCIV
jgi:hypothetical protein